MIVIVLLFSTFASCLFSSRQKEALDLFVFHTSTVGHPAEAGRIVGNREHSILLRYGSPSEASPCAGRMIDKKKHTIFLRFTPPHLVTLLERCV
jgi:hypothetical protein